MLTRRLLIVALASSCIAAPAHAKSKPPEAVIAAIYKKVSAGKGDSGGVFIFLEEKDRRKYFSARTVKLWHDADAKVAPGDQNPPGFDPVSNSQDPKVLNVKVELEKSDGKTATVAASFDSWSRGLTREEQERNPPDPRDRITVRYDMVLERGRWMIDDIRGTTDGKEWSIRAIIKGWDGG